MKHPQYFLILLATIFSALLDANAEPEAFKIGVLLPLTGEVADYGAKVRTGIESISQSGIELIYEDDACQSAKALSGYQSLKQRGVQFFLGPCCGASMKTVAPHFADAEQLSFATCPISDESHTVSNGRVLMPQYSVEDESSFNADQIFLRGFKRVVLLFQDTELARSHERVFRKTFRGTIVDSLVYNGADVMQLRPLLLKLKQKDFDAIYVPHVEPFLLGVLKEMKRIGILNKQVFSIYSSQMPEVLTVNGQATEGFLYSYPDIPLHADAISYFPKLAAEMLGTALTTCSGKYNCVSNYLKTNYRFSDSGVLKRAIILRTVRDGKFALTH